MDTGLMTHFFPSTMIADGCLTEFPHFIILPSSKKPILHLVWLKWIKHTLKM